MAKGTVQEPTYSESAMGVRITPARAMQELRAHGFGDEGSKLEFLAECGDREFYMASDVLDWLGY